MFAGEDRDCGIGFLDRGGGIEDRLFGEDIGKRWSGCQTCFLWRGNIGIAFPEANSLWRMRRVDDVIFWFLGNASWHDWF